MPIVAVGMIYYGGTALAAGAVGWAALAAGTMVVGGAASLVGTATGDKKLESDGMMVGTIGSLGYGALSAGGYSGVAGSATTTTAAGTETGLKAGTSTSGLNAEGATLSTPAADTAAASMPASGTASGTGAATGNSDLAQILARSDANAAKLAQQNLIAQTTTGVAQGYASYEQGKDAKETADEMRDEQRRLTERDYADRNNLTGLTMPDASSLNLPNLTKQAKQKGLISASPTTLQVK